MCTSLQVFNVSTFRHTAHIKSIAQFSPRLFSICAVIVAKSTSILFLRWGKSAGSRGTSIRSFLNPQRNKSLGVRPGERGGHEKQALSLDPMWLIQRSGTVTFNQSHASLYN